MHSALVGYATSALAHLVQNEGRTVSVREIAEARAIPAPYLAKIVRELSVKRIVRTRRGIGVALAADPDRTTLHDLCVAFDDPVLRPECILGRPECDARNACALHAEIEAIREQEWAFLRRTTLRDVAEADERAQRKRPSRTRRAR